MINVYLDIETIPCQSAEYRTRVREGIKPPGTIKKPESILQWLEENAETATDEAVAKTSFDPAYGHICCIGWAIGDDPVQSLSAPIVSDEADILRGFFDALPKMGMAKFIGHYITGFDLRFIMCRAIVLGVKIPSIWPRDPKPWDQSVFDTMVAWAGARGTISQDKLCEALGLSGKGYFDGSMVAAAWANGEHQRIAEYCRSDVETVRAIHRRFEAVGF